MEYWVRLRVPMEQAIRLFKVQYKADSFIGSGSAGFQRYVVLFWQERSKALGYLNAQDYKALEKTGDELPSDVNELFITITRCSDLKARREGIVMGLGLGWPAKKFMYLSRHFHVLKVSSLVFVSDVQPSPYVVYRFYDFADHDTDIISNSNQPQWNDRKTCPVPMTEELDTYLRSQVATTSVAKQGRRTGKFQRLNVYFLNRYSLWKCTFWMMWTLRRQHIWVWPKFLSSPSLMERALKEHSI